MAFRLRTLGTVSLTHDGAPLAGRATQRRRLALLALLAATRDRGLTRDKVVAYLWPERDMDGARHTLSQTLYAIRQDMGDGVILSGVDELRLNGAVCGSDIADFEQAIAAGRLEEASAVYGGPFLDGFFLGEAPDFERWMEDERRRLAVAYGDALESLASSFEMRGEPRSVIDCWRRRAALEPLNGRVALGLMRSLAAAGDRAGAIQHARVHAVLLRSELDVDADDAVTALAASLRDAPDGATPGTAARHSANGSGGAPGTRPQLTTDRPRSAEYVPGPTMPPAGAALPDGSLSPASPPVPRPVPAAPARTPEVATRQMRPRFRPGVFVTGAVVLVVAIGAAAWSVRGSLPDPPRKIVLGAMTGPDSILALAVREALLGGLATSPRIDVVSDARVSETLRLMRLPPDETLVPTVATEVAQRRGASLAIVGGVTPLGTGVQLTVRLLDARSGTPLVTLAETPASENEIVPAVGRLAIELRNRVLGTRVLAPGDSLPAVSTASIDALRSYAMARRSLARQDRGEAIALLEAAIVHDSTFALAHYLAGDLLWFTDNQRHSEAHLASAHHLSERLPPRERLIVRARYEQLIRDRPDSALAAWKALARTYPDDALAFEGMGWAYRALAMHREAAAAAGRALELDPDAVAPNVNNRVFSLIAMRDTTAAFEFARDIPLEVSSARTFAEYSAAMMRGDFSTALTVALQGVEPGDSLGGMRAAVWQHPALLALGRIEEARQALAVIVATNGAQNAPRALLLQGRVELAIGVRPERARNLARQTLEWIEGADLSPPAYARLAERTADLAARTGDRAMIAALRAFIERQDDGRSLPSYGLALLTIDASDAYARGDWLAAAELAARSKAGIYFGRSTSTVALLEADARAAAGQSDRARAIREELVAGVPRDNDGETMQVLAALGRLAGEDGGRPHVR